MKGYVYIVHKRSERVENARNYFWRSYINWPWRPFCTSAYEASIITEELTKRNPIGFTYTPVNAKLIDVQEEMKIINFTRTFTDKYFKDKGVFNPNEFNEILWLMSIMHIWSESDLKIRASRIVDLACQYDATHVLIDPPKFMELYLIEAFIDQKIQPIYPHQVEVIDVLKFT